MTRRSFAIFFLYTYALVLFRPLFPVVDYLLNKDFISKNLCENRNKPKMKCNGKCHLMKQLKKANSGQETPVNNSSQKNGSQEENTIHTASSFNSIITSGIGLEKQFFSFHKNYIPSDFGTGVFHPPCFA